ncbi:MAG: histidine--tRNA ligase [Candidatus Colwellbacteria bacterium]|jgi:histidyl-tRNA synthetase|nr:histidine--tRNA ligase [Candidatus Colwellbacteria bacterium]MDD4818841.1 histidine--tRNA ligase [Candidatus Colwellbacteria bacterium]
MSNTAPKEQKEEKQISKKKISFQTPKGMRDILPEEFHYWEKARAVASEIADFYGFGQIETPVLEQAELFSRGVGMGTDIVEKEMYVLKTKGGDTLALRPEFTAPIMRSFIENGMSKKPQPVKLWYFGPNFRHERPQAGRFRQFYQAGFEIVGGEPDPIFDAKIMLASVHFLEKMKVKDVILEVNSIGCKQCRGIYKKKLQDFYRKEIEAYNGKKGGLICKDCEKRLEVNPLRLLDCKEERCAELRANAPSILDSLCSPCRSHFKGVLEFLDEVKIPYSLNPYLVRGLDYYNRTVFELFSEGEGIALGGGGRYDYLAEMIGGKNTPAVGVALGVDRIISMLQEKEEGAEIKKKRRAFLAHVGDTAKQKAFALSEEFYKSGIKIIDAFGKKSLQAQLKVADKENCPIALIIGQKEVYEETVILRDMKTGTQENVPVSKIIEKVKKKLNGK